MSEATKLKEANLALYERLVSGDESAFEEMVLLNKSMVTYKVMTYLDEYPQLVHLKDDLLSAGAVGLVKAVKIMQKRGPRENPNPTGMMSKHIYYHIVDVADLEAAIRVPKRSFEKRMKTGNPLTVPVKQKSLTVRDTLEREAMTDPRTMVDLWDALLACCGNDTERQVIELRTQNYGDPAIGKIVGLGSFDVYYLRKKIYERFVEQNPEYAQRD